MSGGFGLSVAPGCENWAARLNRVTVLGSVNSSHSIKKNSNFRTTQKILMTY